MSGSLTWQKHEDGNYLWLSVSIQYAFSLRNRAVIEFTVNLMWVQLQTFSELTVLYTRQCSLQGQEMTFKFHGI